MMTFVFIQCCVRQHHQNVLTLKQLNIVFQAITQTLPAALKEPIIKHSIFIKWCYLLIFITGIGSSCKQHKGNKEGMHRTFAQTPATAEEEPMWGLPDKGWLRIYGDDLCVCMLGGADRKLV